MVSTFGEGVACLTPGMRQPTYMLKRMQLLKPAPMSLGDFRQALAASPQLGLRFRLPTGGLTPIHLHLTEVARVEKRYIDCGGTIRTDVSARLQLWAADDTDHRVGCAKALQVLDRGAGLVGATDVPLEVEHDFPFLTVFPVVGSVVEGGERIFLLAAKQADCLAPDVCIPNACKPGSGCC
jgi:hypothetical protein